MLTVAVLKNDSNYGHYPVANNLLRCWAVSLARAENTVLSIAGCLNLFQSLLVREKEKKQQ